MLIPHSDGVGFIFQDAPDISDSNIIVPFSVSLLVAEISAEVVEWSLFGLPPPPPLFTNQPERQLQKQVQDRLSERILGQQILYYPIDIYRTNYHSIYGESVQKSFLDPVQVYVLIEWEGFESNTTKYGVDKKSKLVVHFNNRRLTEDQNIYVHIGDFILYNNKYYEIIVLDKPKLLYGGHRDHRTEITATCIRSRQGLFGVN